MKRLAFVNLYVETIKAKWQAEVKAGTMRPSEFAVSCVALEENAHKFWRKYRGTFRDCTDAEVRAMFTGPSKGEASNG